jgi:hypothetical protein
MLLLVLLGILFAGMIVLLLRPNRHEYDGAAWTTPGAEAESGAELLAASETVSVDDVAAGGESVAEVAAEPERQKPVHRLFNRYEYYLRDGRGPFTFREAQTMLGIPVDKCKRAFNDLNVEWKSQIIRKEKLSANSGS